MIPMEFHELLRFVGVTKEARQRIINRISKAIRYAATDSIYYARRAHKNRPQAPMTDPEPAPAPRPRQVPLALSKDRGQWEGPSSGNPQLREEQARQHQTSLAPAREKARLMDLCRLREEQLHIARLGSQGTGHFTMVSRTQTAGGTVITAAHGGTQTLAAYRTVQPRIWHGVERWYTWRARFLQAASAKGWNRRSSRQPSLSRSRLPG